MFARRRSRARLPTVVLWIVVCIWSALTLTAIGLVGWSTVKNMRSAAYPTTPGVVAASSVRSEPGSHGPLYTAEVRFTYTVVGQPLESSKYRYAPMSSSDQSEADAIVAQHPIGAAVTVHYNPANPADAVLMTGIDGPTRFIWLFLTPFTLAMLGLWQGALWHFSGRAARGPEFSQDANPRANLGMVSSPVVGLAVLGLTSFLSIFPWAFLGGTRLTAAQLAATFAAVGAVSIVAAIWHFQQSRAGDHDVVIDTARRTIILPAEHAAVVPGRTLPIQKVRSIDVVTPHGSTDGTLDEVVLAFDGESGPRSVTLYRAFTPAAADDFRGKLQSLLGIHDG